MDAYARFMIHFLDELAVERAHLVGHSHGGRVSIALAADEPDRVGRLLLIDSAGIPPQARLALPAPRGGGEAGPAARKARRRPGRRLQERMRAKVASRDYLEASEAMRGTFRAAVAANLTDRLPRIARLDAAGVGRPGRRHAALDGEADGGADPDAGLVVLEGAGHYSYADSPGQFRAVARRFLLEQPRQAAAKR